MEVALKEISAPRHRLFHRRVAEAMESLYAHRRDSVAGLLARHYAEGGAPERAAKYAFRAGQLAADLAAWSEAIAFYEQALAESETLNDPAQKQAILLALGQACLQAGQLARASETLRAGFELAKEDQNQANAGVLYLNLAGALLLSNRSGEVLALAEEISASSRPEDAANAAYLRGLALAHNSSDLAGAIVHLQQAEALLRQPGQESYPAEGVVSLNQIEFELGNIFAQRGDLPAAVEHYRAGVEVTRNMKDVKTLWNHVLFYNNLAYHLLLLGDPAAAEYANHGLALAQEKGALLLLPYLHSTLGEIALARHDLAAAERHFNEGLTLAWQFSVPERIAGLTANLGLLAKQHGQQERAIEQLTSALAQAEALSLPFLATQIRLWLVPLLPSSEARTHLAAARSTAEHDGYQRLLAEATRLETEIQ
jgi:tetratricopeptide (TPR) repeat protein